MPRSIPKTVKDWIDKPYVDLQFGKKFVLELKANGVDVYDSML